MTHSHVLLDSLRNPAVHDHPVQEVDVIETHISWVLLTGRFVYKIKKPVNLGFLDFSTLDKRRLYCREELRLNRRLAPRYYLDVVSVTGTPERPELDGDGPILEYAVKMLQFPQDAQLDRMAARGLLQKQHIDLLATRLAAFHGSVGVAGRDSACGGPRGIRHLAMENFERVFAALENESDIIRLQRLEEWTEREYEARRDAFTVRQEQGFVRECHGDMHLRNMALVDDDLIIFDCIEFSEELRWIDVMSEVAFTVMDLDDRGHDYLARRFLNAYLEMTGDYEGLRVLRFYLVYRAMVRAMVDIIRTGQSEVGDEEKNKLLQEYRSYIDLARGYTRAARPGLVITHGFSGSGKSTVARALLEHRSAICIRSDVERRRLFGLSANARTHSKAERGLYTQDANRRTYAKLSGLATGALESGFTAIVDAAFLRKAERDEFRDLARRLEAPFVILDCRATETILEQRVVTREQAGRDASEATAAVLAHQLEHHEPLTEPEKERTIVIDTTQPVDGTRIADALRERMG